MPPISSVQEIENNKSNDEKNNKSQNDKVVNGDTDAAASKKINLKPPTKPDEEAHRKSLDEINTRIDKLREQQASITEKFANFVNNESKSQKREELNAQLDKLRGKQSEIKKIRNKTFEQIKLTNDSLQKKKKDLKGAKSKLRFKSLEDIDAEIINSEKLIESGNITLVREKQLVLEISGLKKSRKTVESLSALQMSIDVDQKAIDEMKRSLELSDFKEINEKYDELKSQLDMVNKDQAEDKEKRNELNDEKKRIRSLIDEEYSKRKLLMDEYHKAKQEHYNWQNEERRRRNELQKQKKEQYEREKIEKLTKHKLEQASIPAFQDHIITCDNLINYFKSTYGIVKTTTEGNDNSAQSLEPESEINIRKPDSTSNVPEGTILVKKANRDDDYFTGSSKTSKKKSKDKKSSNSSRQNAHFQLPISIIEQLDFVQVMVPLKNIDVEKVIDELIEKKKYYIENQDLVTKKNILEAETEIAALINNLNNNNNNNNNYKKKNQQKNDYNNNNNNNNNKSFSNDDGNNGVVANDDVDSTKNKAVDNTINKGDQKISDLSTKTEIETASSITTTATTISPPPPPPTTTTTITVENK